MMEWRRMARADRHPRVAMTIQAVGILITAASFLPAQIPPDSSPADLPWNVAPESGEEFSIPLDSDAASRIDERISLLNSPSFEERERAAKELTDIGAAAFPRLREAYRNNDILEVQLRIELIVRTAYLDFHVYNPNGFLGISQKSTTPTHEDDPRIPFGHIGIELENVVKNTGAERAGLQKGDIIMSLDGEFLTGAGQRATRAFGEMIKSRRPGTIVHVAVLRGEEEFEISIPLGRAPSEMVESGRVASLTEPLLRAQARFSDWWQTHFLDEPVRSNDNPVPGSSE